ncbi:Frizzled/smoothened-like sans CRD protein [Trichinella spiralis]|uniref:Frizzled/smoothened-like sans CRD protein n=1 Tax=Trichinella spiralis TaxID=6334 RepID=A0ABR3KE20_TRISP
MLDVYEMKIPPVLINTDQWAFPCVAISPKPFLPFQCAIAENFALDQFNRSTNNNLEIKVSYQTKKNSSLAIHSCINLAQMNEHLIPFCLVVCICFELMFGFLFRQKIAVESAE